MVMGGKSSKQQAEGARCRRHPRHRQPGAGVCAFCLRERLSRLSLSSSLPSVVVRGDEASSSRCSEASTAYSSSEGGSTGCSSAAAGCSSPGFFHDEMRRAAGVRVSLLMRHERVVGDADAVAAFLKARREQQRTATSFWAKLLHAATRGGEAKTRRHDDVRGCSVAHSKTTTTTTLQERVAAAKWVLF